MLEKLTYSGKEGHQSVYFAFDASHFDVKKVTEVLKIQPTSVRIKETPGPKSTSWKYGLDAGKELDLEMYLAQLIDIFEPKTKEINALKAQFGLTTRLQFVLHIDIHPEASTPYFGRNKRAISFLYQTGTEVDYDVYKADTIGLFPQLND